MTVKQKQYAMIDTLQQVLKRIPQKFKIGDTQYTYNKSRFSVYIIAFLFGADRFVKIEIHPSIPVERFVYLEFLLPVKRSETPATIRLLMTRARSEIGTDEATKKAMRSQALDLFAVAVYLFNRASAINRDVSFTNYPEIAVKVPTVNFNSIWLDKDAEMGAKELIHMLSEYRFELSSALDKRFETLLSLQEGKGKEKYAFLNFTRKK